MLSNMHSKYYRQSNKHLGFFNSATAEYFTEFYRIINIETQRTNIVNNSLAECFNVSAIAIAMTKVSGST